MVMLEDQGVPNVSAHLRWSQGVLNFQNSPHPRVVLLSIKINTIFHERRWISNGYCINRGYTGKKTIKMHFRNGMPMYADILFSEMPCYILCPVRVPPNVGGFYE